MTSDALVLDASVTATWLLPDEHDDASRRAYARLRRGAVEAHAPELWRQISIQDGLALGFRHVGRSPWIVRGLMLDLELGLFGRSCRGLKSLSRQHGFYLFDTSSGAGMITAGLGENGFLVDRLEALTDYPDR